MVDTTISRALNLPGWESIGYSFSKWKSIGRYSNSPFFAFEIKLINSITIGKKGMRKMNEKIQQQQTESFQVQFSLVSSSIFPAFTVVPKLFSTSAIIFSFSFLLFLSSKSLVYTIKCQSCLCSFLVFWLKVVCVLVIYSCARVVLKYWEISWNVLTLPKMIPLWLNQRKTNWHGKAITWYGIC